VLRGDRRAPGVWGATSTTGSATGTTRLLTAGDRPFVEPGHDRVTRAATCRPRHAVGRLSRVGGFRDASGSHPSCCWSVLPSTTLDGPLPWPNSTLLKGRHRRFRRRSKRVQQRPHILGSGALIQSLMRYDLIDEYMLTIHRFVSAPDVASSADTARSPHYTHRLDDNHHRCDIATYRPGSVSAPIAR